ncbi:MAG: hypothetical protein Phyf2KO_26300 [Phycisphaerales bacterium]
MKGCVACVHNTTPRPLEERAWCECDPLIAGPVGQEGGEPVGVAIGAVGCLLRVCSKPIRGDAAGCEDGIKD